MKVEILTTSDCSNCQILEKMLDELGISYDLIDIAEKPEYLKRYPIFTAPGLVIDGKLEFVGVPKKDRLKKIFSQAGNVF